MFSLKAFITILRVILPMFNETGKAFDTSAGNMIE
jgi:hypothetical protein